MTLETVILDADGREVARSTTHADPLARCDGGGARPDHTTAAQALGAGPTRISTRRSATLRRGGDVVDRYRTPFGVRSIEWGPAGASC